MGMWSDFASADPPLASAVHSLLCQYGPGLGYLATLRPDGWPRIHPVSPVITDGALFCFLISSAKRRDLERDGRYALHSCPPECSDDEACLAGIASPVLDRIRVQRIARAARAKPGGDWRLFEFSVDRAMVVHRSMHGAVSGSDPGVSRRIWRG